ncbi:MAG TPA: hypothetical protein VNL18_09440, partial [Gemmatimonadales bacterium]|nr:hypothetical protein [Gemmatimonadales bacterium]
MRHAAFLVLVGMTLWAPACSSPPGASAAGGGPAPSTARGGRALYHRLGGYDAIAAVVDDFLRRMIGDSMLAG